MARRISSNGDLIIDVEPGDESREEFRSYRYGDEYFGTDSGDWVLRTGRTERGRVNADGTTTGVFAAGGSHAVLTVAASNAPARYTAIADYTCDGTDDDVQIQAAIDAATPGGIVQLSPGNFVGGQLVVKDRVWLRGTGMYGTEYKLKNTANADVIINFVSPDGIVANAEFIAVTDLRIDGNKANQTSGRGIFLDANPQSTKATNDLDFDPHNRVQNVMIYNCKNDGFQALNRSETRLDNVYTYKCDGNGFGPSYDTWFVNCTAAWSGLAGFLFQHSSVRVIACKAFYSGQVTATSGRGFDVSGTHGIVLEGCEAQDNNDAGFRISGSTGCRISGSCDSNSTRGVGLAPAIDMSSATNNIIDVVCVEREAVAPNSYQQNAIRLLSTCTGNDVRLGHSAWGTATIGAALMPGSDATTGNRVFANAVAI